MHFFASFHLLLLCFLSWTFFSFALPVETTSVPNPSFHSAEAAPIESSPAPTQPTVDPSPLPSQLSVQSSLFAHSKDDKLSRIRDWRDRHGGDEKANQQRLALFEKTHHDELGRQIMTHQDINRDLTKQAQEEADRQEAERERKAAEEGAAKQPEDKKLKLTPSQEELKKKEAEEKARDAEFWKSMGVSPTVLDRSFSRKSAPKALEASDRKKRDEQLAAKRQEDKIREAREAEVKRLKESQLTTKEAPPVDNKQLKNLSSTLQKHTNGAQDIYQASRQRAPPQMTRDEFAKATGHINAGRKALEEAGMNGMVTPEAAAKRKAEVDAKKAKAAKVAAEVKVEGSGTGPATTPETSTTTSKDVKGKGLAAVTAPAVVPSNSAPPPLVRVPTESSTHSTASAVSHIAVKPLRA